jgi:hypothetical protein
MKIKKLEWFITKGFITDRWYARAIGIEWTIPVSSGTAQDNKRVLAEKEKAQNEFERRIQDWIEDSDVANVTRDDTNNSPDNFYLCVLEKIFGKMSDSTWRGVLAGFSPPWPRPEILERMGLVPRGSATIVNVDDKGVATVVTPTAKDRVIDHLIQEHAEVSKWHKTAAERGQVGLTPGLRERLKSIESALAIAVKDGDISEAKQQKE